MGLRHRHRHHGLGVASAFRGHAVGDFGRGLALAEQRLGAQLVQQRKHHHRERRGQCEGAERPVHQEGDGEENRRPRHVEECGRPGAGHELPHGRKIAQRLVGDVAAGFEPAARDGLERRRAEHAVETAGHAIEDLAANPFQQPERNIEDDQQDRQRHERRDAVAGQHAVVDLQHVQWPGQHQDVDEQAENAGDQERVPDRSQGLVKRVLLAGRGTAGH